jgi:hypothetical protein
MYPWMEEQVPQDEGGKVAMAPRSQPISNPRRAARSELPNMLHAHGETMKGNEYGRYLLQQEANWVFQ